MSLDLYMGTALGASLSICGVMVFFMFRNKRFPVRIPIMVQRGDSYVEDLDERGRYTKNKQGYEALRLMKSKKNVKPPKFKDLSMDIKGKPIYRMFKTTTGQMFPMKVTKKPSFEVIEDTSAKNWTILELQRTEAKYAPQESFLMKYGVFIMNATFAAMVIFFVIYFGGKIEQVSGSLGGAANALTNAVNAMSAG